ncbi:MAG: Gfo/Idh/MocA family oxidoreductase, partial [Candidatus Omnitrophota bacterium]|nr:Gfo/Idh/MocA family oxidoreductase [Candidatus Omnitrophota bacterium]
RILIDMKPAMALRTAETQTPELTGVVVLGTGSMGSQHLAVLGQLGTVQPIAVPTRVGRLEVLRRRGMSAVGDLREAVAYGATRCIVATETNRHVDDGLAAIEYGLDVLVEKPLSTTAEGARPLMTQATQRGCRVFVGCVLRFSESLQTFRTLMERVGRLHAVRIECQSYLPDWRPARPYRQSYSARAEEGGVLRDLIHEIDYAGWLFGWPDRLQARVRNLGRLGIDADETAELHWETRVGCAVSIRLDYLTKPPRRRLMAFGERGTIEWDGMAQTVRVCIGEAPPHTVTSSQTREDMLLAQDRAFIQVSREMADPRLATGCDGVNALAVCDAARRSSHSRREEPVVYA